MPQSKTGRRANVKPYITEIREKLSQIFLNTYPCISVLTGLPDRLVHKDTTHPNTKWAAGQCSEERSSSDTNISLCELQENKDSDQGRENNLHGNLSALLVHLMQFKVCNFNDKTSQMGTKTFSIENRSPVCFVCIFRALWCTTDLMGLFWSHTFHLSGVCLESPSWTFPDCSFSTPQSSSQRPGWELAVGKTGP